MDRRPRPQETGTSGDGQKRGLQDTTTEDYLPLPPSGPEEGDKNGRDPSLRCERVDRPELTRVWTFSVESFYRSTCPEPLVRRYSLTLRAYSTTLPKHLPEEYLVDMTESSQTPWTLLHRDRVQSNPFVEVYFHLNW